MSNRLGGKQGTAYLGTNANQPPNMTFHTNDPDQYDTQNVSLGDLWLNETSKELFVLVSLKNDGSTGVKGAYATWKKLDSNTGAGILDTLTGDTGGVINPDGASNITFRSGIAGLSFAGNPATSIITLTSAGGAGEVMQTATGNSGGAVSPTAGNINIVGDGVGITITGNPGTHTLTASLVGAGSFADAFNGDTGTALPLAGDVNIIADTVSQNSGSSVTFVGSGNTVQLNMTDASSNTIIGKSSGNATLTGTTNTSIGALNVSSLTSGSRNVFLGYNVGSLVTTGSDNFLCGNSLSNPILQGSTTATGFYALGASTLLFLHNWGGAGSGNTFIGYGSGGSFDVGQQAGNTNNTGAGRSTLQTITTGTKNSAFGFGAGINITSGSSNTLLGQDAGKSYVSNESSNICIGYNTVGTVTESNVLRIASGTGTSAGQVNKAFVGGIYGITPAIASPLPVVIDSSGQLGTSAATLLETLTGNSGGAIGPLAGNINVIGDGTTVTVVGTPNTLTISALGGSAPTSFPTDVGGSAVPIANVLQIKTNNNAGASVKTVAASNLILIQMTDAQNNTIIGESSGNSAATGTNNTILGFSSGSIVTTASSNTIIGDTAATALTTGADNIIIGSESGNNYTSNESFNILIGSSGTLNDTSILRIGESTGSGAGLLSKTFVQGIYNITPDVASPKSVVIDSAGQLGTVDAGSSVTSLTGNSGGAVSALLGNINVIGDGTTATVVGNPGTNTLTISSLGGGGVLTIFPTDSGTAIPAAGLLNIKTNLDSGSTVKFTGVSNVVLLNLSDANFNTALGTNAGNVAQTGSDNTFVGVGAASNITSGSENVIIGVTAGVSVKSGNRNILIGEGAGSAFNSNESNNIIFNSDGVITQSNTLRIGTSTGTGSKQLYKSFIHGIRGISVGAGDGIPVLIDSQGQLGTAGGTAGYASSFPTDSGTAVPVAGVLNINAGNAANDSGSSVKFIGSSNEVALKLTDTGLNTMIGNTVGNLSITGEGNSALGSFCGYALTTGEFNTIMGAGAGSAITEGSYNIIMGSSSGSAALSNESNNILFNSPGVINQSNSLHIGLSTGNGVQQLNKAFIHGIRGITPDVGDGIPVYIDSAGQLGTVGGSGASTTSFLAYLTTNSANVTGDSGGTIYQIVYDTFPYNFGAAYNTGSGVFTAPVTGVYNFSYSVFATGPFTEQTYQAYIKLTISGIEFSQDVLPPVPSGVTAAPRKWYSGQNNVYAKMTAGDTAYITVQSYISGSVTETTYLQGIGGNAPLGIPTGVVNFFSGSLVA